jgi:hypothetical protein
VDDAAQAIIHIADVQKRSKMRERSEQISQSDFARKHRGFRIKALVTDHIAVPGAAKQG